MIEEINLSRIVSNNEGDVEAIQFDLIHKINEMIETINKLVDMHNELAGEVASLNTEVGKLLGER